MSTNDGFNVGVMVGDNDGLKCWRTARCNVCNVGTFVGVKLRDIDGLNVSEYVGALDGF